MKNISTLIIIGLLIWWLTRKLEEAKAAPLETGKVFPTIEGRRELLLPLENISLLIPIFPSAEGGA